MIKILSSFPLFNAKIRTTFAKKEILGVDVLISFSWDGINHVSGVLLHHFIGQ